MEDGWTILDTVKSRAPTTHGRVVVIAAAALRDASRPDEDQQHLNA